MKNKKITIHGIKDMGDFIKEASKVNGDVTCKKGVYVVDAKSIMGVVSIDMSTGVLVSYPEDAIEFDQYIEQFAD